MITPRRSQERGHANHGWLNTYHTFSFANYYDPQFMGFRSLRVINEDWVEGGRGFGRHPHADMEIITYVLDGALQHADSMGNGSVIQSGQFQKMSAGSGIEHSEFNASKMEPVHLYQIWLLPGERGITPSYAEATIEAASKEGQLSLVAAPEGETAPITLHQDAWLYVGSPNGRPLEHALESGRHAWVQVTQGAVTLNGMELAAGDGAAVSEEEHLQISGQGEVLLFDLA